MAQFFNLVLLLNKLGYNFFLAFQGFDAQVCVQFAIQIQTKAQFEIL